MNARTNCGAAIVVAVLVVCLNAEPARAQSAAELTERGRLALINRQFDASLADLNADMERYVDFMEEWLRNRSG